MIVEVAKESEEAFLEFIGGGREERDLDRERERVPWNRLKSGLLEEVAAVGGGADICFVDESDLSNACAGTIPFDPSNRLPSSTF